MNLKKIKNTLFLSVIILSAFVLQIAAQQRTNPQTYNAANTALQPGGVLNKIINTLGQTVQRTLDTTGNIVEKTLDTPGKVVNQKIKKQLARF